MSAEIAGVKEFGLGVL